MKSFILVSILFLLVALNAFADVRLYPQQLHEITHLYDIEESHDDVDTNDISERTKAARKADQEFWKLIHGENNYKNFDKVIHKLNKAHIKDPSDVYTIAHIGWANMWALSEGIGIGIAQQENALLYIQIAEEKFSQASRLAPDEPRILGFLGYSRLALGAATQNIDLLIKGQANVNRSIDLWPEWAHFGAAYGQDASAPYNSPQFMQALEHYWQTLDVCANTPIDRGNPDFFPYIPQQTLVGPDRACWDSWIAPYNLEGFFLIMGDSLVKAGNTNAAFIIYNNAKLLNNYNSWPFRDLLENRISNIQNNINTFRQPISVGQAVDLETTMIVNTSISCAICHRGDADKYFERPDWVGENANEYFRPF